MAMVDLVTPFSTPPPFTKPAPLVDNIFNIDMLSNPNESDGITNTSTSSPEFVLTSNDITLTSVVRYLVIRSQIPRKIILPAIRENQEMVIRITTIDSRIEPCCHSIVPHDLDETIQEQDIYAVCGSAMLVSHKRKWYVF